MMEHATALDEPLTSSHATTAAVVDPGFFERERNRLIQDISKGVESVLGNANVLNRKIEESISVGKEFHPISELWSKFERIMLASGIPNLYPGAVSAGNAASTTASAGAGSAGASASARARAGIPGASTGNTTDGSNDDHVRRATEDDGIRFETASNPLPPGVAPGGGRIYAA